jgi:hypothetical protein
MRPMDIHGLASPCAEKNPPAILLQGDGKPDLGQRFKFANLCIAFHKLQDKHVQTLTGRPERHSYRRGGLSLAVTCEN